MNSSQLEKLASDMEAKANELNKITESGMPLSLAIFGPLAAQWREAAAVLRKRARQLPPDEPAEKPDVALLSGLSAERRVDAFLAEDSGDAADRRQRLIDMLDAHANPLCRGAVTFAALRAANVSRCNGAFHPLGDWSLTDYACAAAGELGEACNIVNKLRRHDFALEGKRGELGDELADTVIYLDLLATRAGIVLGEAVRSKFNRVSEQRGSAIRL